MSAYLPLLLKDQHFGVVVAMIQLAPPVEACWSIKRVYWPALGRIPVIKAFLGEVVVFSDDNSSPECLMSDVADQPLILTDNPIKGRENDQFGFGTHGGVLCDAIEATDDLPLTVGVFGPWGTGKSSFLNICRDILDRRGIPTIAFNPWKYDEKEAIWHALIQTILTEIADASDGPRHELMDKAKRLSSTATWLLLRHAAAPLTAGLVGRDDLTAARDAWRASGVENYRHINHFESDFADVVKTMIGDRGRLVVFVDDLDRCHADTAIAVLDALNSSSANPVAFSFLRWTLM